jgi:hypothetical protein
MNGTLAHILAICTLILLQETKAEITTLAICSRIDCLQLALQCNRLPTLQPALMYYQQQQQLC